MITTKLMLLRPYSFPLTSFLSPPRFFSISAATTAAVSLSSTLPYGPSLHKGHKPSKPQFHPFFDHKLQQNDEEEQLESSNHKTELFNEEDFSRVFDIAALRVPSDHCFALENRIRGHLLNWPRIRNLVRVSGDDIEEDFKKLLESQNNLKSSDDDSDSLVSLNRRIYGKAEGDGELLSPVLYRDKLVQSFNSRGFVKFRNLAKMSRPKRRKKKEEVKANGGREKKGVGRNGVYLVEVEEEEGEDLSGLLGDEFKGRKWRGPTRLLLLDERYANKDVEEMPEAIKQVFTDCCSQSLTSSIELVRCKLTLFYTYWQMNEILEALLPKGMIVPSAFETVGHIAHLNLRDEHHPYKKLIAKVVLDKNKPKIQTVVNKIDAIQNDYRTMQLEVLAGNHSVVTSVVENGLRFHVDLSTVYWNSKLATERQRLLNCFTQRDVVCDVFAGVGPIAIAAAKRVKHVYANDLNPHAVDFLQRNCVLNKLERKIEVFNMDARRFLDAVFATPKARPISQVVMNLPKDATEYLDAFRGIFRETMNKEFTLPKVHVYGFSKAQDPEFDFQERIRIALSEVAFEIEVHRVRLVAPGKWMLCASFILPARVAFTKDV